MTENGQVYAWGDNDHGQQGNGTTVVNRKPALVHGLEDVHINRVACGSSHSIAWTLQDCQTISKVEPVIFPVAKDPLGSSILGLYVGEKPQIRLKDKNAPTLSGIVMSLESNTAKQQALQHILNAMHIQQLRQSIVKALCSHTNIKNNTKVIIPAYNNFLNIPQFFNFILSKLVLLRHHWKDHLLMEVYFIKMEKLHLEVEKPQFLLPKLLQLR